MPRTFQNETLWAMVPAAFENRLNAARQHAAEFGVVMTKDLKVFAGFGDFDAAKKPYRVESGTAIIEINGAVCKTASFWGWLCGDEVSAMSLIDALRTAASDKDVRQILMVIDSPGGTVAGTADAANEVARVNVIKPVTAFVSDFCASAAYWIASQASRVVMNNATAQVGSIGTYAVLQDWSQLYAKEGVKVNVIKAGAFKGLGEHGTPVTDAQVAEMQRIVNEINASFVLAVGRGRKMTPEKVAAVADGRLFVGQGAVVAGLADAIEPLEFVLSSLSKQVVATMTKAKSKIVATTVQGKANTMPTEVPDPIYAKDARVVVNGKPGAAVSSQALNVYNVAFDDGTTDEYAAELECTAETDTAAAPPADGAGAAPAARNGNAFATARTVIAKFPADAARIMTLAESGHSADAIELDLLRARFAKTPQAAAPRVAVRPVVRQAATPSATPGAAAQTVAEPVGVDAADLADTVRVATTGDAIDHVTEVQFNADVKLKGEFRTFKAFDAYRRNRDSSKFKG